MDHIKVLKRAFEITWRYRALWIFGIILALVTGGGFSGSGGAPGGDGRQGIWPPDGQGFGPPDWGWSYTAPDIPQEIVNTVIIAGVGLLCLIFFIAVVTTVARWVTETALIRMVDGYEETGEKRSVREGFRMGWSRTAWRLFLIELLLDVPTAVVFMGLFALALSPLLLWLLDVVALGVVGTVAAIGSFFFVIFLAIIVGLVFGALKPFFRRACALEQVGVIESLRQGFGIVRRHLVDVVIMWVLLLGLRIGLVVVMIPLVFLVIPLMLVLLIVGAILGALPALLVGGLLSLFFEGPVPWIVGAVVGLPILMLVVASPWVFLSGLVEVFKSSLWTLTYRELRALENVEPEPDALPEPEVLDVE
jgi:hypothetical protein